MSALTWNTVFMVTDAYNSKGNLRTGRWGQGAMMLFHHSEVYHSILHNHKLLVIITVTLCTTHFMLQCCHTRFIIPCPCVHFPKGCELLITCLLLMLRTILVYHRELTNDCWKVRLDYCTGTNKTTFYGNKIKEYLRLKKKNPQLPKYNMGNSWFGNGFCE